ncbi:hypothetical protein Ocin01_19970 [Orchesella cincta]|uniref:Tyr recombinase domain-containing protein n=1 Tax=Orchesella cincta TaxID=48709 RepID=A0A1D2M186_ORCCI|nr:hypothetical protein Ocin01_19970 [Orchesella cincta]
MEFRPEGVYFPTVHLRKTSRPNHLPVAFYGAFYGNPKLCVVTTLKEYINRTQFLRGSTRLVISYVKPHKPVTPSTISRWICNVIHAAGVPLSYGAHSSRSAATTAAKFCTHMYI